MCRHACEMIWMACGITAIYISQSWVQHSSLKMAANSLVHLACCRLESPERLELARTAMQTLQGRMHSESLLQPVTLHLRNLSHFNHRVGRPFSCRSNAYTLFKLNLSFQPRQHPLARQKLSRCCARQLARRNPAAEHMY